MVCSVDGGFKQAGDVFSTNANLEELVLWLVDTGVSMGGPGPDQPAQNFLKLFLDSEPFFRELSSRIQMSEVLEEFKNRKITLL